MPSNGFFYGTMWLALKRTVFVLSDNVTTIFSYNSPTFNINIELSDASAYSYSETERNFTDDGSTDLEAEVLQHFSGTMEHYLVLLN